MVFIKIYWFFCQTIEDKTEFFMREQIINFLQHEIVGPDPIPPLVQENGEEILDKDSPTVRESEKKQGRFRIKSYL